MKNCVFCEIGSGHTETRPVYQDNLVYAVLTLEQPTPYKVAIIPYAHVETIYDLTDEQAAAIFQATVTVARAVRDVSGCEGMNLVQSNGRVGQQDVFHLGVFKMSWPLVGVCVRQVIALGTVPYRTQTPTNQF